MGLAFKQTFSFLLLLCLCSMAYAIPAGGGAGYYVNCPEELNNHLGMIKISGGDKKIEVVKRKLFVESNRYYECPKNSEVKELGGGFVCKNNDLLALSGHVDPQIKVFIDTNVIINSKCGYYILVK